MLIRQTNTCTCTCAVYVYMYACTGYNYRLVPLAQHRTVFAGIEDHSMDFRRSCAGECDVAAVVWVVVGFD